MQVVKVSQTKDREAWLEMRRGVIGSSKVKGIAPPKRGNSTPQGVFELLAEKLAISKDGEPERERGLRLEDEALLLTAKKFELDFNLDAGMWLTDDGKLAVSPDAAENTGILAPTYAGEAKCLDSKNHLQAIYNDVVGKKFPNYSPLDSLKVSTSDYTHQAIQYFVVNPKLETLYFTFYDDRIALDNLMHYVIVIKRDDVNEFIDGQEAYERNALKQVDEMIKVLRGVK